MPPHRAPKTWGGSPPKKKLLRRHEKPWLIRILEPAALCACVFVYVYLYVFRTSARFSGGTTTTASKNTYTHKYSQREIKLFGRTGGSRAASILCGSGGLLPLASWDVEKAFTQNETQGCRLAGLAAAPDCDWWLSTGFYLCGCEYGV